MDADEFSLCLFNRGEVAHFIENSLYDKKSLIVVVMVDKVWDENKRFAYDYFDRIVVTPTANLRPQVVNMAERMLKIQDLVAFGDYMPASVKRQIARKWGNT